jgi:formylglycine-generating enzyme
VARRSTYSLMTGACVFLLTSVYARQISAAPQGMTKIYGSTFRPFDAKKSQKPIRVQSFFVDIYPVTTASFGKFVAQNPEWNKDNVPAIKADSGYLKNVKLQATPDNVVMTQVSWYAARAYCRAQGKRLPTLYEWEFAATYKGWDKRPDVNARIIGWFGKPNDMNATATIGTGLVSPNGVHDLHGLIWEWVEDFNSSTVTGDSRSDTDTESNLFCGASALSGNDLRNYATYMRYGMRSSLKGNYTGHNLGFRCAKDIK